MDNYFCAKNLFRVWDSVTVDFSFTAVKGTMTVILPFVVVNERSTVTESHTRKRFFA